jgi:sigma 54 modulation/S30EA-like ribosomal protein
VEPDGAAMMAIESVERQLRRHKDKVKDHRGRAEEGGLGLAMDGLGAELLDNEGSVFEDDGFRLKDLTVAQAEEFYQDSDAPFFVFRNIDTGKVAVVYRRDDKGTGVMKPE